MKTVTVIHCWSGPRSRSTALLYAFEARGDDCVALDEPLYRKWLLSKGDTVSRPYATEMIQGVGEWEQAALPLEDRLSVAAESLPHGGVIFCKHVAKQALYDFANELAIPQVNLLHRHIILIRDPVVLLAAWGAVKSNHNNNPSSEEVGVVPLLSIYTSLENKPNKPLVIDSDDLALDPAATLSCICTVVGIDYRESMLSWKSGPHKCDGPWAKWWYKTVWKSQGFEKSAISKYRTLDPSLMPALKAAFPAYTFLQQLTLSYSTRGPPPAQKYEDPRNEHVLVWIGAPGRGQLFPRDMACVNPWDSIVQGGDGAWEGIRVYRGKVFSLEKHLRRLFRSAKALGYQNVHTKEEIVEAIFRTLAANGMRDNAHMRLTLTRGEKCTSSMNPKFNVYGTTLIILPEWKPPEGATSYDNTKGISLISASQRRNSPSTVDSKIHHNNMINNILPKIQANLAGAEDAIQLDLNGYVAETNATNIFMVDDEGVLLTPTPDHCLPGITRGTVLELAKELNIPCEVRNISLAEFHAAEEVFTTGTMGELTPVIMIDGRVIGNGERGMITKRLQDVYKTLPERPGWATEIPPFEEH